MACIYNYKGHIFSSELELDDFLIEREKYVSILGDIAFSSSIRQNDVHSKLLKIKEQCEKLKEEYNKYRHSKASYDEDGSEILDVPPYIGVNKYIAQPRPNGDRWVREFKDKEYWSRSFENWQKGVFTDSEREWFNLSPTYSESWSESECKAKKKEIMAKWDSQAKIGTAVHEVLQLFFTDTTGENDNTVKVFNLENPKEYILNNLSEANKKYLNPETINKAIQYATNLKEQLTSKYGENLLFFPEFAVDGMATEDGVQTRLYGIIDLLVVDKTGKVHIIDYKTSIKPYEKFGSDKQMAYQYQMATYQRMLQRHGISTTEGDLYVAPIQITGFKKDGDSFKYHTIDINHPIEKLNNFVTKTQRDNIDLFMPPVFNISITTEDARKVVSEFMSKSFENYDSSKSHTEKQVIEELKRGGYLEKKEGEDYSYKPAGSSEAPITASTEAEFVQKVLAYKQSLPAKRLQIMGDIKSVFKEAIKQGSPEVDWPLPAQTRTGITVTWLKDTLSPYCHDTWQVQDNEFYESFGIITLFNENTKQIDLVRISTSNLDYNYFQSLDKKDPKRNRLSLIGAFEPDVVEQSNSNSLMTEAVYGNIELMETMAVLNASDVPKGCVIGNIQVINPYDAKGVSMSNEELFYCFNRLNRYVPMFRNQFDDKTIELASKFQLAYNKFKDIMYRGEAKQWRDTYKAFSDFQTCTSIMDQAVYKGASEQIEALIQLKNKMEEDKRVGASLSRTYTDQSDLQKDHIALYNMILTAIADLKGINFRQQLKDHRQWLESVANLSGTYLDNPGNLSSETLNLITRLVTEAYQNTRDETQISKNRIEAAVKKFKQAKGFSYLQENIGFNQADLYKNLFVETPDGDLLFKNLTELDSAEREFLDFALQEINKNRHPKWTKEIMEHKRDTYDPEYYRVPLARGSSASVASSRGLLRMFRDKLSQYNIFKPKQMFEIARQKAEGIYESLKDPVKEANIENLYKMTNLFDTGEETAESRKEAIKRIGGVFKLERNMETLLLKHDFAFIQQQNIDKVFPLIKAATIHLSLQGANQNDAFKDDLKYVQEYIKNKVFNQSIVNPENQKFTTIAGMLKKAASMLTLAFSPVQAIYQPLQGLWQDISLVIRNPDGKDAFTFKHFKNSLKIVYSELLDFSGKPTLCSLLNEIYGINDMDMNTYVDRISHAKKGLFYNFDNFAFKFASRPDYYNRMSIFLSQMQGDGCLEAHTLENGVLKYDWTKDSRFSKFAANPNDKYSTDPEYIKQRSLYYAIAKQFENEHTKMPDGVTDFVVKMDDPMPLPRAYTNKQAESMKSLSDDIYGYYSHEKKSMIMSTALGSMWLQFKTYWSGKKNQYLQKGGVRLRGSWEPYIEKDADGNEVKYYYQTDADGNILFDKPTLSEEKMIAQNKPLIAPVMQWKGQWQEGILVTLGDIAINTVRDPKHFLKYIQDKWNTEDKNLRNCYRSNIKQFGYDLIMFMIVGSIIGGLLGDWLKDLKDENKANTDFITGLKLAGANVAVMSVKNSFLDFNFFGSVGSPIHTWTPFAVEWSTRQYKNIAKVTSGDEDIWDGIVNIASVNKQIKPLLDTIKPEQFRTKREGGTWESATAKANREKRENQ